MEGTATKFLSVPVILDAIERAEMAASVSWPADRLYALWKQAKPQGAPDPEWFDPEDEEEIDLDIDVLKNLLREALAAELIRARGRGESMVVIDAGERAPEQKH